MVTFRGFEAIEDADRQTRIRNADDRTLIESSIRSILLTIPGERVMLPEFGSRLTLLVFELLDEILKEQLRRETFEALLRWENRIIIEDVVIQEEEDNDQAVIVIIKYRLREGIQDTLNFALKLEIQ